MNAWTLFARCIAVAAVAAGACTGAAAQKAAEQKPQAAAQQPPAGSGTMGYGVRLGGFFSEQHKEAAKRSFQQYFAKTKTCPKDMHKEGKTCRALVKGSYWAVGQPIQKAVETFPLPEEVTAKLPPPPQGYEYVRAGEDILLVSKGMRLVVDMIPNAIG